MKPKTLHIVRAAALISGVALGGAALYGSSLKTRSLASMYPPSRTVTGPLVSVVIPALSEEDYLPMLLKSISNQTYSSTETVISDSSPEGPKAATADLVATWSSSISIKMIDSPKKNVSLGRNTGADAATGQYLLFMDADCIMEPDYIEKMVADMNHCHMAHGLDVYYDGDLVNTLKAFYNMLKPRMHTTGRGVMISHDDFNYLGGYDEDLDPSNSMAREDLDLGDRVESKFGQGAVYLDRNAVVAEAYRRPWSHTGSGRVWDHRGWRKGMTIDGNYAGIMAVVK